jgi:hypothetical protein
MSDEALMEIQRSLGRIEQKIDSAADTLVAHTADDKRIQTAFFDRIEKLQLAQARQRGFITALGTVGSVLGAGFGYFVERWLRH